MKVIVQYNNTKDEFVTEDDNYPALLLFFQKNKVNTSVVSFVFLAASFFFFWIVRCVRSETGNVNVEREKTGEGGGN